MFGIGIRVVTTIFLIISINPLFSQCPCLEDDCGDVIAAFALDGNQTIVCDGSDFTVSNNTDANQGITEYIWDWGDGTIETFSTNQDVTHSYDIPDSLVCLDDKTNYQICLVVRKTCADGESCHSISLPVGVVHRPKAILEGNNQICRDDPISVNNTSCNVEDYFWDFGNGDTSTEADPNYEFPTAGVYNITLMVTNECGSDSDNLTVEAVDNPVADASISPLPTDNKICVGQILTFTDLSNEWSNTTWQITPTGDQNWCFTDTAMTLNSDVIEVEFKDDKEYTIRLLAQNVCGADTWEETIEVLDGPTANLQDAPSFCETGNYTPQVSYTGEITNYMWTFENGNPSTSTDPFPTDIEYNGVGGDVTLIIESACGDLTISTQVIVNNMVDVSITAPAQICQGSSPDTLLVNQSGGTWGGMGVDDDGVFDPSGLDGTFSITYTIDAGACSSSDMVEILVTPSAAVTTSNPSVCVDGDTIQLTATPTGGTWSGDHVSTIGIFDIISAGEGTFPSTYSLVDDNGCNVEAISMVTVDPLPIVSMLDTTVICAGGGMVDLIDISQFTADQTGGIISFSIDGATVNNPYTILLSFGSYDLEANYISGPCEVVTNSIISVIDPPILTISNDTSLCINLGTYQLESNISGGTWIGPGIDNNGLIDLNIAGGGMHNYSYTILPSTTCETTDNVNITITDPGANLDAGPDVFICENEFTNYTFAGFSPANGSWAGESIDGSNGTITVGALVIDSLYTYQYCVENDQFVDCQACDTRTFIVRPLPEPSFDFIGGVCVGDTFTTINTTTNGQTYEWDFGDGTTSTEFEPSHAYTVSDNYTITLKATSSFGCMLSTSTGIYVSRPPTVDFNLDVTEGCAPLPITLTNNSFGDDISYQWIINGDTSNLETPTGIILDGITTDTIIEVRLDVINTCGTVTQIETVMVRPYPIVKIDSDVDEGCSPLLIDFANKTIGNPETYLWDLGNGNSSTDSIPPDQIYTTTDSTVTVYTVSLTSTNECGTSYGELEITVFPPDVEAFIAIDTMMVCQYDTFSVQSQSTAGSIITWSIFDEDGALTDGYNSENPEIIISEAGRFMIVLYASRCGTDSDTTFIDVLPAPEVEFDIPDFVCLGDSLLLSTVSSNLSETIWDFGDGYTSDESTTHLIFDSVGLYEISLTGYSSVNNCPFTVTKSIEVLGLPMSSFIPDQLSGCRPLTINFTNTSQQGDAYSWEWGDGTSGSNEENPVHTFNEAGTFAVSLRTFDEFGCFADTTVINIIVHDLPTSIFATDSDQYCQFYDSIRLTNSSIDATGSLWIIQGDTIDQEAPVLPTETSGLVNINLIVTNQFGCQDVSSQSVNILPSPVADFTPSDTVGCQPLNVNLDNTSLSGTDYIWSIGSDDTSSDINYQYKFIDKGIQNVQLIAINENGCPNDTAIISIDVLEKPTADFQFVKDKECGVPNLVTFANLSASNIVDNEWAFGTGATSSVANPTIEYIMDQDYAVQLQVENMVGCLDTAEQTVPIWLAPTADFSVIKTEYCEGESINITNDSENAIFYTWEIENQEDVEDFNPKISFDQSGNYNISLIVEYNEACKDTLSINNYFQIYNQPTADFSFIINQDENILGDVDFENESIDYTSVLWDLGDENFSSEEGFLYEYDINRDVFVTLYAYNDNNGQYLCTDSITKPVEPEWLTQFFAPNAVSPDYGDEGVNKFTPKGIGIASYEINVYSPWGEVVWTSTAIEDDHPSESWDGKIINTESHAPMGAYTWLADVIFVNGVKKKYQGTVTILR